MADKSRKKLRLSDFPSISSVLEDDRLKPLIEQWSFPFVSKEVKSLASMLKKQAQKSGQTPSKGDLISEILFLFRKYEKELLCPVINGTGVVLHTNLGRAPISPGGFGEIKEAVCGYSNLEFDINENKRSKRGTMVGRMLAAISGADSGMMVNNNASSVYMIVANLAAGKEVIISRGQLIQIGGGFRIPEIIERSGAKLKEVGTTNKTTITDYRKAINKNTGLVLVVHKSNFVQKGFTEEPELSRIVEIAGEKKVPVCYDLGSGMPSAIGDIVPDEPDIKKCVRSKADLVCFSGDKLLGGAQAGLIVGKRKYIASLLKDPLYRVVRPGKITIGLMEKTLLGLLKDEAGNPCWEMAALSTADLKRRAKSIVRQVGDGRVSAVELRSSFGGGTLPDCEFDSFGVKIAGKPGEISKKLRACSPPVVSRSIPSGVLLDLRTVFPQQDKTVIDSIKSCL